MPLVRTAVRAALLALALLPIGGAASVAAQTPRGAAAPLVDTLAIRAHTRFLADDKLAGRGTGTEGERLAAAYIASQLHRLGLTPITGDTSFLLPIPLREAFIDPATRVTLIAGNDSTVFRSGIDFVVNTGGPDAFRDFRGRARFLGQPIHAVNRVPRERSLSGSVAVFMGPLGGFAVDLIPMLTGAGVTGIVLLVPDSAQFDLYVRSRGESRFFVDAPVGDPVWQPALPAIIAGPSLTEALLAGARIPEETVQGAAAPGVDLDRTVQAVIRTDVRTVDAANIGAVLPGSDPALRNEYVVYTAHYDHLGRSTPDASGDSIYNGFSDNAAGTAMLLAIAEALRTAPPQRSVAFLFFTGEERGLLGSSYLAAAPPIPLDRIRALINLDAGAPPAPPLNWRIAGGENTPLGRLAADVAARHGWEAVLGAASPNSDYWPFLQRGVPSIFIIPGPDWENTSPEERDALRRRWDRYHQPADHWHADFPFAGLKRYATYALLIGLAAADR
ncbi:MAG TPA: M28 family peptidase [Longimicrobiales bacterium]